MHQTTELQNKAITDTEIIKLTNRIDKYISHNNG